MRAEDVNDIEELDRALISRIVLRAADAASLPEEAAVEIARKGGLLDAGIVVRFPTPSLDGPGPVTHSPAVARAGHQVR